MAVTRRDNLGYVLVGASFLVFGSIGALVRMTTMPESALIVGRVVIGALLVGLVFARRPMLDELRDRRTVGWLVLMGLFSASTLLLFFIALRLTDVAIGTFLMFTGPVYVALVAPRFLHQRADRVVYPALGLAVVGMVTILLPSVLGAQRVSLVGVACGVATGLLYACYALTTKFLTRTTRSVTIALSEMVLDGLILLPLAAWQVADTGYRLTRHDLLVTLVLGVVCTAIPYVLYVEGLRRIRVEHASILGYLEPVSAPFYALLLLGEATTAPTVVGGALIVAAGVLVVAFGSPEAEAGEVVPT
ncbi:MAG: DMT family transporter [Thermoleophilia bacterium]